MSVVNPLTNQPLLFHPPAPPASFDPSPLPQLQSHFMSHYHNNSNNIINHHNLHDHLVLKTEQQQQDFTLIRPDIPSWIASHGTTTTSSSPYSPLMLEHHHYVQESHQPPPALPATSVPNLHISATALLQKAAQMGSTISRPSPQIHSQMAGHSINGGTLGLTSSLGEKCYGNGSTDSSHFLHMMNSLTQASGSVEGMARSSRMSEEGGNGGGGGRNDELTRDFLGLRTFSHRDLLNMTGMETCMSSSSYDQQSNKKPWHGN